MKRGFIALAVVALLFTAAVGPAAGASAVDAPAEPSVTTEYVVFQPGEEVPDFETTSVLGLPPGIEHRGP